MGAHALLHAARPRKYPSPPRLRLLLAPSCVSLHPSHTHTPLFSLFAPLWALQRKLVGVLYRMGVQCVAYSPLGGQVGADRRHKGRGARHSGREEGPERGRKRGREGKCGDSGEPMVRVRSCGCVYLVTQGPCSYLALLLPLPPPTHTHTHTHTQSAVKPNELLHDERVTAIAKEAGRSNAQVCVRVCVQSWKRERTGRARPVLMSCQGGILVASAARQSVGARVWYERPPPSFAHSLACKCFYARPTTRPPRC